MRTIGRRYEIRTALAHGGMGEVWEGLDQRLNRSVAIKLISSSRSLPGRASSDEARRRFYREARIVARLRHPGVPVLYDFGLDGDAFYLVMELVPGHTLADLIAEEHPLDVSWAALIGAQVSAVLAAAHAVGLVHRDLKPPNVVIGPDGAVKVLDFGVAVALDRSEFSQITAAGQVPGTACYLAPELIDGSRADVRSDLYAVGCLLYELLADSRVFASGDLATELGRHMSEHPQSIRAVRPEVPPEFEQLIFELLAKDPAIRPPSAARVFERLLPLVAALPPLPGLLRQADAAHAIHMYATALQRVADIT